MKKSRAAVAPAAMLAISPVVSPALAVDVVFTVGEGAVESYVDAVFMDEVRIVVLNVDAIFLMKRRLLGGIVSLNGWIR